jgi:hypothetical protein
MQEDWTLGMTLRLSVLTCSLQTVPCPEDPDYGSYYHTRGQEDCCLLPEVHTSCVEGKIQHDEGEPDCTGQDRCGDACDERDHFPFWLLSLRLRLLRFVLQTPACSRNSAGKTALLQLELATSVGDNILLVA